MSLSVTHFAGAGANNSSAGSFAWSNTSRITASDDSRTTAASTGAGDTNYLVASDFRFDLPSAARLNGIALHIERQNPSVSNVFDKRVSLVVRNSFKTTNKGFFSSLWTNTDQTANYGGPLDMWSEVIIPTDVNRTDFGCVFQYTRTGNSTAGIDAISMTVYYTVPELTITHPTSSIYGNKTLTRINVGVEDTTVTATKFVFTDPSGDSFTLVTDASGVTNVDTPPYVLSAGLGTLDIDLPGNIYTLNVYDTYDEQLLVSETIYKIVKGSFGLKTTRNDADGSDIKDTTITYTSRGATIVAPSHVDDTVVSNGVRIVNS